MDYSMMEYAFFQGRIVPFADAKISIGTHSVQYGTGAFAGIRGYLDDDGTSINIFRLPDHAQRLLNSGRLLRAELPFDRESLASTIVSLVERNAPKGDVYIRPFIYKPGIQLTPRLRGLGDELAIYMLPMGDYLQLDRGQRALEIRGELAQAQFHYVGFFAACSRRTTCCTASDCISFRSFASSDSRASTSDSLNVYERRTTTSPASSSGRRTR